MMDHVFFPLIKMKDLEKFFVVLFRIGESFSFIHFMMDHVFFPLIKMKDLEMKLLNIFCMSLLFSLLTIYKPYLLINSIN